MRNNGTKFRIQVDKMHDREWSIGIGLSHWCDETYLFINVIRWRISIGFLYSEIEDGE